MQLKSFLEGIDKKTNGSPQPDVAEKSIFGEGRREKVRDANLREEVIDSLA